MTQSSIPQLHVVGNPMSGKTTLPAQVGKHIEFAEILNLQLVEPVATKGSLPELAAEPEMAKPEETVALDVSKEEDPNEPATQEDSETQSAVAVMISPPPQRAATSETILSMAMRPRAIAAEALRDLPRPVDAIPQSAEYKARVEVRANVSEKVVLTDGKKANVSSLLQSDQRSPEIELKVPKESLAQTNNPSAVPTSQQAASTAVGTPVPLPFVAQVGQQNPIPKSNSEKREIEPAIGSGADLKTSSMKPISDASVRTPESIQLPELMKRRAVETVIEGKSLDPTDGSAEEELFLSNRLTRPSTDVLQPQTLPPQSQQSAQIARSVATQMAVAVTQNGTGTTEIMLAPEELGKVRMLVTAQDTAITVVIHAERPETGDTLRRHIETLAQEFRNMGYGSINFTFEGGQGRGADQAQVMEDSGQDAGSTREDDAIEQPYHAHPQSGLDLRL